MIIYCTSVQDQVTTQMCPAQIYENASRTKEYHKDSSLEHRGMLSSTQDVNIQVYLRCSKCTKGYHYCHSITSPSVLLPLLVDIQLRHCQLHCTDSFSQKDGQMEQLVTAHNSMANVAYIFVSESINCFKNGL